MLNSVLIAIFLVVSVPNSTQFGWYRFDQKCYVSGDASYLEKWKVNKCTDYTDTLIFDDCLLELIEDDAFEDLKTTFLSLENNKLKEIGSWLSPLTELKFFSMSHNLLTKVSSRSFIQQKKLQMLTLSYNEIDRIEEDAFENLSKLDYIRLSYNKLKEVKNELRYLVNVLQIDLSHNLIENVHEDAFKNCTKIGEIQLSYNKLKTLPDNFYLKAILKRIYVSNNELERADFLKDCVNMDTLDLSHNKFSELTFINLLKLDTLYLHFNQLSHTTIKEIITKHSSSLRWISFNNNRLSCLGLVELWSELQSGTVKIMDKYNYKAKVKINEIGCDDAVTSSLIDVRIKN